MHEAWTALVEAFHPGLRFPTPLMQSGLSVLELSSGQCLKDIWSCPKGLWKHLIHTKWSCQNTHAQKTLLAQIAHNMYLYFGFTELIHKKYQHESRTFWCAKCPSREGMLSSLCSLLKFTYMCHRTGDRELCLFRLTLMMALTN